MKTQAFITPMVMTSRSLLIPTKPLKTYGKPLVFAGLHSVPLSSFREGTVVRPCVFTAFSLIFINVMVIAEVDVIESVTSQTRKENCLKV